MEISTLDQLTQVLDGTKFLTSDAKLAAYTTLLTKIRTDLVNDNLVTPANNKSLSQQGILSLLQGYISSQQLANELANRLATTTTRGFTFLNNPVTIAFSGSTAMNVSAGVVQYDNGLAQLACSAIAGKVIQSSGSWSAGSSGNGLDTGARANTTWYNIFEIVNNSTGANDILYSISRTSPTVPSGYTLVAWIGAVRTNASSNIDSSYLAKRTSFGQLVRFQTGAYTSGIKTIPEDNSPPEITEGDEYMSLQITPLNANSELEIIARAYISNSAATPRIGALFQDSTVNAIVSGQHYDNITSAMTPMTLKHSMISGTTSATTFRFRAGGGTAGTTYFNGIAGAQLFNGTMGSSITIKEYL